MPSQAIRDLSRRIASNANHLPTTAKGSEIEAKQDIKSQHDRPRNR
jgi:hypothetical protein